MIGSVGMGGSPYYSPIQYGFAAGATGMPGSVNPVEKTDATGKVTGIDKENQTGIDDPIAKASGKQKCETCKNRKYVDGSDEMVSFKSPAKINPGSALAAVSAHEQEHVSNAYKKAEQKGGEVLQASVALKTAICPECGRSYIAGGETTTRIKYPNDKNPYMKNLKSANYDATAGANFDTAV